MAPAKHIWAGRWPHMSDFILKTLTDAKADTYCSKRFFISDCELANEFIDGFKSHRIAITGERWDQIQEELNADFADARPEAARVRFKGNSCHKMYCRDAALMGKLIGYAVERFFKPMVFGKKGGNLRRMKKVIRARRARKGGRT